MNVSTLLDVEITQAKIYMLEIMSNNEYDSDAFMEAEEAYFELYEEELIRDMVEECA